MAYSADTFVADEQPTTAKWNKLWTNDASFNDGTGIGAVIGNAHFLSGVPVQVASFRTGAVATGTTIMPFDDTIPQNTEGDQYMSLAITPKSATNRLMFIVSAWWSHSAANCQGGVALFQDTTADALAVSEIYENTNTAVNMVPLTHDMVAGTTSSTTFKIRIGSQNAGTTTFNGQSSLRRYGGVAASGIQILEYKA
jgi:hypothetical protein